MENTENQRGSHMDEPVRTPENLSATEWLTVDEAVSLCAEHGLSRTPKTLRKWAERSFQKEDAEIIVRREDTMWAYRWKFEKASLLRKIEQEVSLSGANQSAPVRTSAVDNKAANDDPATVLNSAPQVNVSEPVRTRTEGFGRDTDVKSGERGANSTEPVHTRSHPSAEASMVLEEVRDRLRDKDKEIAFLRGQLEKAQAEVGRRATSTDDALKTIDRVVHSFELQAEANRALALRDAGGSTQADLTKPIRFAPESVEVSLADEEAATDPDYQQPGRFAG